MEDIKHKLFLKWLIYISSVIGLMSLGVVTGLFEKAILFDKSYLIIVMTALWILVEIKLAKTAIVLSNNINQIKHLYLWCKEHRKDLKIYVRSKMIIVSGFSSKDQSTKTLSINNKFIVSFANKLFDRKFNNSNYALGSSDILKNLEDELFDNNTANHYNAIILLIGVIGTVVGIIMTLWPFISLTDLTNLNELMANAGSVWAGIGTALFPSAISLLYSILLMFNDKIIISGSTEMIRVTTDLTESFLLSHMVDEDEPTP